MRTLQESGVRGDYKMDKQARLAISALFTLFWIQTVRPDSSSVAPKPDPLQVANQAFAAKQQQILSGTVTPCKDGVEAVSKPEEEHEETCDCFNSESERQESLAALRRVTAQSLARCDIKGYDTELVYIDQREAAIRATLRDMVSKFQDQARTFESWGGDAKRGRKDAEDKIGEILITQGTGAIADDIIDTDETEMTGRLDQVLDRAHQVKDVRLVRKGELEEVVAALKNEIKGKSKADAKQIVVNRLLAAKVAAKDGAAIEKQLAAEVIESQVPRDDEAGAEAKTQEYLNGGYATLLTTIDIAANHGIKDARIFSRAAGVLAFAPDAVDTAAILYDASVINDNLSGLDELRQAAEQQRGALSAELTVLVAQRRQIETQRHDAIQATAP